MKKRIGWVLASAMTAFAQLATATGTVGPRGGLPSDEQYFEAIERASELIDSEAYEEALPWVVTSAQHGHKASQYMAAVFYLSGYGTDVDYARAYAWASVAAESGERRSLTLKSKIADLFNAAQLEVGERMAGLYIEEYGMDARDIVCSSGRRSGTGVREVQCNRRHFLDPRYNGPGRVSFGLPASR